MCIYEVVLKNGVRSVESGVGEGKAVEFAEHCRSHGWALLEWDEKDCLQEMREDMLRFGLLAQGKGGDRSDRLAQWLVGKDVPSDGRDGCDIPSFRSLLSQWQQIFADSFSLSPHTKETGFDATGDIDIDIDDDLRIDNNGEKNSPPSIAPNPPIRVRRPPITGEASDPDDEVEGRGWVLGTPINELHGKRELENKEVSAPIAHVPDLSLNPALDPTYRNERGLPVGYRRDDEREFFESRTFVLEHSSCDGTKNSNSSSADTVSNTGNVGARNDGASIGPNNCTYDNITSGTDVPPHVLDLCPRYVRKPLASLLSLLLIYLMRRCTVYSITALAGAIGLDPNCFLDVVDVNDASNTRLLLTTIASTVRQSAQSARQRPNPSTFRVSEVSSSLLRVCSYPHPESNAFANKKVMGDTGDKAAPTKEIAFGAHTDTTLLTLGLLSDSPGLELYDKVLDNSDSGGAEYDRDGRGGWLEVERVCREYTEHAEGGGKLRVVVFTGEVLQALTKSHYAATIHRVTVPLLISSADSRGTTGTTDGTFDGVPSGAAARGCRISCPFLVRGKWGSKINMAGLGSDGEDGSPKPTTLPTRPNNISTGEAPELWGGRSHPGGQDSVDRYVPDLDGIDVKVLHKILDIKRAKCRKRNEGRQDANWVLASYPETAVIR